MTKSALTLSTARQRGVGLVAALFLLVVLAALGAFIVTISGVQQVTPVFAVQGARAYHAARSGIEWAVHQALNTPLGTMCGNPGPITTGPFAVSGPGLNGFQVTVNCSYTQHKEGAPTFEVFAITSTATFGTFGSPDFFSRTIEAAVTNAPAP